MNQDLKDGRKTQPLYKEDFTPEELEKLKTLAPDEYRLLRSRTREEELKRNEAEARKQLDRTIESIILEAEIMTEMEKMWKHPSQ